MKLVFTEGGVCNGITIDGKKTNELTHEEKCSIVNKIIEIDGDFFNAIISKWLEETGSFEELGKCKVTHEWVQEYSRILD